MPTSGIPAKIMSVAYALDDRRDTLNANGNGRIQTVTLDIEVRILEFGAIHTVWVILT